MIIAPKGSKVVLVDWLNTEILIITTQAQHEEFLKLNEDAPEHFRSAWKENNGYACHVEVSGEPSFIVLLRSRKVLVHECVHVAEMVMESKGIRFSARNMFEVRAYMIDYVVRLVKKSLQRG